MYKNFTKKNMQEYKNYIINRLQINTITNQIKLQIK